MRLFVSQEGNRMARDLDGRALETYYRSLSFKEEILEMIALDANGAGTEKGTLPLFPIVVQYSSRTPRRSSTVLRI
jgi:hypothetical protein